MKNLSQYMLNGRDNNFNLLRVLAAISVLFSHCFALATGDVSIEPFKKQIGFSLGNIAVDVFFVTSGFLIAMSIVTKKNVIKFLWARFLRIFPGLVVSLFITVVIAGLFFSALSFDKYVVQKNTIFYLLKNSLVILGPQHTLPGVFLNLPYANEVNGSIWSLQYELLMYLILALFSFIIQFFFRRINYESSFKIIILLLTGLLFLSLYMNHRFFTVDDRFLHTGFFFFMGASFYVLNKRIAFSWLFFIIALLLLMVAPRADIRIFNLLYYVTLPYLVLFLAFYLSGKIRNFNKIGDFSYGIYIYAFPIQQVIVSLYKLHNSLMLFIVSLPVVICFAIVSWYLIEKKSLGYKTLFDRYGLPAKST